MNDKESKHEVDVRLDRIYDQIVGAESATEDKANEALIRGARDALKMIERVRSQQMRETPRGGETFSDLERAVREDTVQQFGRFEIKRKLGQGGFGVVFLADDPDLRREVAIKIPRFDSDSAELRERFFREGRAAAALTHPNIVPVFESGFIGKHFFTASQFIPGSSLAEFSQTRQLTPRESVSIVRRLAEAMEHAHQRGVLHRDIKPANILVEDNSQEPLENRIKLTDFGLAKHLGEDSLQTKTGALVGTPAYMSPEQIGDVQNVCPASDIYSIGAVLYELLSGQPPFVGNSVFDTLDQVRSKDVEPPSKRRTGISADLDAICLKCLEKSPGSRYRSCFDLAEDLSRFLRNEPISARRIGPLVRLGRWYSRNRVVATVGSLAFLSLILGLTGTLWMYGQSQANLATASEQSELANRGLDRTKRSIDKMLTDVSLALADQPRMDGLRKRLLTEARDLYHEILNDNYVKRVDSAKALDSFFRLAVMERQLGNSDQAQAMAQQGLQAFEAISAEEKIKTDVLVSWARLVRVDYEVQVATGKPAREDIRSVIDKLGQLDTDEVDPLTCLAEAYRQSGIDLLSQGKPDDALTDLQLAIEVLDGVNPDLSSDTVVFIKAQTLNSLAIAHKAARDFDSALENYQQVVSIMTQLVAEFPERARYQEMRAIVSLNLGNLYFSRKNLDAAELAYQDSSTAAEDLLLLFPDRKVFWETSNRAANGLGLVHYKLGIYESSEQAYLKSINGWKTLQATLGGSPTIANGLSRALGGAANLMRALGRFDESRSFHREAIQLNREQVDEFPSRLGLKKSLSLGIGNLADLELDAGRASEALARFEEALDIALDLHETNPDYPGQISNLNYQFTGVAVVQAILGQHARAHETVERMAGFLPDNVLQLKQGVDVYGSIVDELTKSDAMDEAELQEKVESYSENARKLIQLAEELGADTSQWLTEPPANSLKFY